MASPSPGCWCEACAVARRDSHKPVFDPDDDRYNSWQARAVHAEAEVERLRLAVSREKEAR